eukprot:s390_g5.t1
MRWLQRCCKSSFRIGEDGSKTVRASTSRDFSQQKALGATLQVEMPTEADGIEIPPKAYEELSASPSAKDAEASPAEAAEVDSPDEEAEEVAEAPESPSSRAQDDT